jgi:transposase
MTPEKMFHEMLGLGMSWEVKDSRFEKESGTVFLEIGEKEQLWEGLRCPKDGGYTFCYDHTEEVSWRHLNVFEHRCEIRCRLPRGKCRSCGHVFRVRPPWEGLSTHFTKQFEALALLLIREMPVAKAAQIIGETDMRLWRMTFKHVEQAYAGADFSQVCCVGVDELNIRKGHEYLSVFADLVAKRVLFATEGKDKQVWGKFVEALEKHNGHRHAITQVSMDMSAAYQSGAAENCRNAQVVFDKYHIIANTNKAIDRVRKAEIRSGAKDVFKQLYKTQWLWRKNPTNLTAKEERRLKKIDQENLATAKAYQMKLALQKIYEEPLVSVAEDRFQLWCRWVKEVASRQAKNVMAAMVKVADMILNHLKGILAHWKWRLTNAFMEGLNSVFQATKRKARGYRSSEYLITILYLTAGKLRIPQS